MSCSRLVITLGPTFHDHGEIELLVDDNGDSLAQLSFASNEFSATAPYEASIELIAKALDYLQIAKAEEQQGARDGIHGKFILEASGHDTIDLEYWSPIRSDASYKLFKETLDLLAPLFDESKVSAYLVNIRSYLH